MAAKNLGELRVFQSALKIDALVSAILTNARLQQDRALRDQTSACATAIAANIAEGFSQGTDRHFAHYLRIARGSCNELQVHLTAARTRELIPPDAASEALATIDHTGRMLTRLIGHLDRSQRHNRG